MNSQHLTTAGAARRQLHTDTVDLPVVWASALVNNDWSGLDAGQTDELNHYLAANPEHAELVSCSEEPHAGIFKGHWHQLLTYTYLTNHQPETPLMKTRFENAIITIALATTIITAAVAIFFLAGY